MKTKVVIFTKAERKFTGQTGEPISGYMYGCVTEENQVLEFWSMTSIYQPVVMLRPRFDPSKAIEVDLESRLGQNKDGSSKIKYRELSA
jgi:hypothetical protein